MLKDRIYTKLCTYGHINVKVSEIAILIDDTVRLSFECLMSDRFPPVYQITISVVLSSLIIETVRYFMADYGAYGGVICILWPVFRKEHPLKDPSWKFCKSGLKRMFCSEGFIRTYTVFHGVVKCVYHSGKTMLPPIGFIDRLPEFFNVLLYEEHRHV